MSQRAKPPDDIAPKDFFARWVPDAVSSDPTRQRRLGETNACIEFELEGGGELEGAGGVTFTVRIANGVVEGGAGPAAAPDLRVRLSVDTWRALNRGDLSAPEALLRRRVHIQGSFLLALKLHLILG
jgi:putative sterol carrier protein